VKHLNLKFLIFSVVAFTSNYTCFANKRCDLIANEGSENWGPGRTLKYSDVKSYAALHELDIGLGLKQIAIHYANLLGSNAETFKAAQEYKNELSEKIEQLENDPNADIQAQFDATYDYELQKHILEQQNPAQNEVGKSNQPGSWGFGKPLKFKDMKAYAREHSLDYSQGLTHIARHYGQAHRGDAETIAAVKAHWKVVNEREKILNADPNLDLELYQANSFDSQTQQESLEMMDWDFALKSKKEDVISTFKKSERH